MAIDDFIDLADLKNLPAELAATFKPSNVIAKGYPFWTLRGDTTSFLMLFFDVLATLFGGIGAMVYVVGFTPEFIYTHFMGGVGISLLFGNIIYALQASKLAMKTGNMNTCAQPYGINTPGMYAKTFAILMPVMWGKLASFGKGPYVGGAPGPAIWADATAEELNEAMTLAWNVGCCANLIGGVIEFIGAFVAPMITRNVPEPAFLVPLSGIGITYLGYMPMVQILESHKAHFPLVGFIPLVITWLGFFGSPPGKFAFGNAPPVAIAAFIGVILFLIVNADGYIAGWDAAMPLIGKGGIAVPDMAATYASEEFATYSALGLILGLSFTNFIGTFGCNISARIEGDIYSPMEQMIIDGLGTILGALFGSPLATTVYIGHPTYKKFGATRGYSVLNGLVYFIFGLGGLLPLMGALLPHECLLGSLVCVGFVIVRQTFEESPGRWYPAVALGIALCFSDMMLGPYVGGVSSAVRVFSSGYVFNSLFYTWALMMLTDRWFIAGSVVFLLLTVATAIGLTHATQPGFIYDETGMHQAGVPGTIETWKICITYLIAAVVCLIFFGLQKAGKFLGPEEEDYRVKQKARYSMSNAKSDTSSA